MALQELQKTDAMISEILQKLNKQTKKLFFNWVKSHSGILGNELTNRLVKEADQNESHSSVFVPFPQSHMKFKLKQNLFINWQTDWDINKKCCTLINSLLKIQLHFKY